MGAIFCGDIGGKVQAALQLIVLTFWVKCVSGHTDWIVCGPCHLLHLQNVEG